MPREGSLVTAILAVGRAYRPRGRRARSAAERFLEKVIVGRPEECWRWTGAHVPDGYGSMMLESRGARDRSSIKAHRFAWLHWIGPIPDGMHVCHHCDVRDCVNPSHLFLGTNADNVADRVRKGRSAGQRGEANHKAKLTEDDVRHIRASRSRARELARHYGVAYETINRVRRGEFWGHVS